MIHFLCLDKVHSLSNRLSYLINYQGDELLSVNGVDVRGKSAFDASSMLQGPKETFVTIKVMDSLNKFYLLDYRSQQSGSLLTQYLTIVVFLMLSLG